MSTEPINTTSITQFIQQVKGAESSNSREVRLDIATAKNLAFTLGIVMSRMNGDLEKFVKEYSTKSSDETITISMDAGSNWS
jgi:hypothetical protein